MRRLIKRPGDANRGDDNLHNGEVEVETLPSRRLLWQPLPVNILPPPLDWFVENISQTIGADPGFFIGPLLAELAGASPS